MPFFQHHARSVLLLSYHGREPSGWVRHIRLEPDGGARSWAEHDRNSVSNILPPSLLPLGSTSLVCNPLIRSSPGCTRAALPPQAHDWARGSSSRSPTSQRLGFIIIPHPKTKDTKRNETHHLLPCLHASMPPFECESSDTLNGSPLRLMSDSLVSGLWSGL